MPPCTNTLPVASSGGPSEALLGEPPDRPGGSPRRPLQFRRFTCRLDVGMAVEVKAIAGKLVCPLLGV